MNPPVLAEVIRGSVVESVHRGHVCMVDGRGKLIGSAGDPATVTFFRSSAKPFQALAALAAGGAAAFGFDERDIALACASHSGEKVHVDGIRRMLGKIGLTESDLRCGAHLPFDEKEAENMIRAGEAPTQLHNNCSGKHAAMLALCRHLGADIDSYESVKNPVQQCILRTVADFAEIAADEIIIGIDGCAAPNFALPLAGMARSFANLVSAERHSDKTDAFRRQIVASMISFPELIGGTDRLDTMLMVAGKGKFVSKVGADGVWLCGVLPSGRFPAGLGVALKIEDGDDRRGRPVVAVDILRRLDLLPDDLMRDISPMLIKNRRGDIVGKVRSTANASGLF